VRRVYRAILQIPPLLDRLDKLGRIAALSPIDRHLYLEASSRRDALFDPSYDQWRTTRINKILEIYGIDYFAGKKILECGAGHAEIGAFLAELGAEVTCLEGRAKNIIVARLKHRRLPRIAIQQFDLEKDFSQFGRFDLIINFGLLYHLPDVDAHLACCFRMADDILLETVVCDSTDPYKIVVYPERKDVIEEALHGTGCRPSPFYVERLAREAGFEAQRFFTADLNVGNQFVYDWVHKNDGDPARWDKRRFWRFVRHAAAEGPPAKN
jgi:SAM-dependent methyltransferase